MEKDPRRSFSSASTTLFYHSTHYPFNSLVLRARGLSATHSHFHSWGRYFGLVCVALPHGQLAHLVSLESASAFWTCCNCTSLFFPVSSLKGSLARLVHSVAGTSILQSLWWAFSFFCWIGRSLCPQLLVLRHYTRLILEESGNGMQVQHRSKRVQSENRLLVAAMVPSS